MSVTPYQTKHTDQLRDLGRVAVLYGGTSSERSVSLQSGKYVIEALQSAGVDTLAIDVQANAIEQLSEQAFDFAFIALHGGDGEGGQIQALLELMGIPFSGSCSRASSLAMNKIHTKQVWQSVGLPTSDFSLVSAQDDLEAIWNQCGPVFVKPASQGSSKGISPAHSYEEFTQAVALASSFESAVIAEKLIDGPEFSVAVLGDQALPAIQIVNHSEFYDFDAKYVSDKTEYICPIDDSVVSSEKLQALAKRAYDALGLRAWGRIDFMLDKSGEIFLLEANTVPGLTTHSLVPMAAKAVGLSFEALLLEIIALSLRGAHER